ncbi:DUF7225 domain-containing protein [Domibacillus enclensis]|uniref:DUF7225 domain-containing protein n=1 Tax=Domibacillus enclensis TaxID=1017273 RepID=UPI003B838DE1
MRVCVPHTYKYMGERAPYTGFIFQKPKGKSKKPVRREIGKWLIFTERKSCWNRDR